MIMLLPLHTPLFYPIYILFQLLQRVGFQFLYDVRVVTLHGLVQYDIHNLTFHIFRPFLGIVVSFTQSIVQLVRVYTQHDDQIKPPFWK